MRARNFSFIPVLVSLLGALALSSALWAQQESAGDALNRAHTMHVELLRQPISERRAANYEAIVEVLKPLFQPASESAAAQRVADSARYEAASIYVAEARDLHRASAYGEAAKVFLDLLHRSPYTAYRRNAEFALAQIQIFHLGEAKAAKAWMRDFEKRYAADPRVAIAHREARGQSVPEPAYLTEAEPATLSAVPSTAPPVHLLKTAERAEAKGATPANVLRPSSRSRSLAVHLGNVEGVQVYTTAASSSVVIALQRSSTFTRTTVAARHEVVFEISTAGAARTARGAGGVLEVHDGRIATVRVEDAVRKGRHVTRVTVAAANGVHLDRGRLFPNPDRLVIAVTPTVK